MKTSELVGASTIKPPISGPGVSIFGWLEPRTLHKFGTLKSLCWPPVAACQAGRRNQMAAIPGA
jgi:hypothetical protein